MSVAELEQVEKAWAPVSQAVRVPRTEADYQQLVELLDRSGVERSTVVVWPASPYTGIAEGEVHFSHGIRLRLREELDFDARLITSYGYEVYRHDERLYWYDDFPHPNNATLATTFPHHKHVPPDIKHNRIEAYPIVKTKKSEN